MNHQANKTVFDIAKNREVIDTIKIGMNLNITDIHVSEPAKILRHSRTATLSSSRAMDQTSIANSQSFFNDKTSRALFE